MSFVLEPHAHGVDLVVTGDWSSAAREALEAGRADGLVLNYAKGFREQPIDFVEGLPIRKLDLLARSLSDLSPVYSLASTLEELRVQSDPRASIELENLPRLRTLAASWPQVRSSIMFASQVKDLAVPSYSEPNLEPLSGLMSLTSLVMKERPKLRSLDGLEAFPWLTRLSVFLASRLADIKAVERFRPPALQVLQIIIATIPLHATDGSGYAGQSILHLVSIPRPDAYYQSAPRSTSERAELFDGAGDSPGPSFSGSVDDPCGSCSCLTLR